MAPDLTWRSLTWTPRVTSSIRRSLLYLRCIRKMPGDALAKQPAIATVNSESLCATAAFTLYVTALMAYCGASASAVLPVDRRITGFHQVPAEEPQEA